MRRWLLVLLGIACLATPASAQVTVGSRAFALKSLTGCATANSVLQGGATVTCTATPQITGLGIGVTAPATGLSFLSTDTLDWNADTILQRDGAADTLALIRGANAETFNVYGNATKKIQLLHDGTDGKVVVSSGKLTTTTGGFSISQDGSANQWYPNADNSFDLGKSSASSAAWRAVFAYQVRNGQAGFLDIGTSSDGIKRLYVDYTNTTTVGPVTINKAAMRVLVAAAGKSIVVTDSLVTAASKVICSNASATPTTPTLVSAVAAAGSFTLTVAQMPSVFAYDCFVINAD